MDYKSMTNEQLINEIELLKKNIDSLDLQTTEVSKDSDDHLSLFFEHAPDAYYLCDLKGTFIDGNKIAEEITGYKKEELIGKSFLKLNLLSKRQIPKAAQLLAKNVLGLSTGPDEFILTRKDNRTVPIEIRTILAKIEEKTVVLGIARDISKRKQTEEALKKAHDELEKRVKEHNAELMRANLEMHTDIIERKKIEDALRESKEQYKMLVENVFNGIYLLREKSYEYVNPRFCEMTGYSFEELTSSDFDYDVILTEDAKKHIQQRFDARKRGEKVPNQYEVKIKNKSGNILYVEVSAVTIGDTKDVHVLGIMRDITEREQSKEQRGKIEFRMATLLQNLPNVVIYETGSGREFISDNIYNLVGYTAEELTKDRAAFPKLIHPEDSPAMEKQLSEWHKTDEPGPIIFQFRIHHKDGRWIWVEDHMIEVKPENGKKYMTGVITDITERKQTDEELRLKNVLFESSIAATSAAGVDGVINLVNPAFLKVWGYENKQEAYGKAIPEFFVNPEDAIPVLNSLNETDEWRGQFLAKRKDNSTFVARGFATTLIDEKNNLIGYQSALVDVTDLTEVEEAGRH
jgi:PAS domain S-box-containing protein